MSVRREPSTSSIRARGAVLRSRRPGVFLVTAALVAAASFSGASTVTAGTPVAQPRISVVDRIVGESDNLVTLVVRMSAPGQNPVSVNYATAESTALDPSDFIHISGTLTFTGTEKTKTVQVQIVDNDLVAEGFESFWFYLHSPVNATLARPESFVSIVDDDTVVDTPRLSVRDTVVDEKAGTASFPVLLGGPTGQASNSTVTVDYATANAGATAGADYTAIPTSTLSFAPGETVKTVVVDITDDAAVEPFERIALNLSSPSGATILDGRGVAVISASDAAAVALPRIALADVVVGESDGYVDAVVSLSAPGQNPVSVVVATDESTALDPSDFIHVSSTITFAGGETTKTIRLELRDDLVAEGFESFWFYLHSPVNATLTDDTALMSIRDTDSGVNVYSYGISDDIYTVVATTDVIIENPGGGTDLVRAPFTYTLGANLENLTLIGAAATNGTGNAAKNRITGNNAANKLNGLGGNDTLIGGGGPDTLTGGTGADTLTGGPAADILVFNSLVGADSVTDFNRIADTFRFSQAGVRIGDGDANVEGAATRSAPGGFSRNAELVIFTSNIAGPITTTKAAAKIGSATSAYTTGSLRLFVVDNGTHTGLFRFRAATANAGVSASELKLIALVKHDATTTSTTVSDFTFAP